MFRPTDDDLRATPKFRPWLRGPLSYQHRATRDGFEIRDPQSGTRITAATLPAGAGAMRDLLHTRRVTFG